jgi:hypothetical protein
MPLRTRADAVRRALCVEIGAAAVCILLAVVVWHDERYERDRGPR